MYAVRFVIREFDLNYYARTDLNQFYGLPQWFWL